jgi:hypothetical protein
MNPYERPTPGVSRRRNQGLTLEQRRRAYSAVTVTSAYGLGSGLLSLLSPLDPDQHDPALAMPAYVWGMVGVLVILLGSFVLNAVGLLLRSWILGEDLADSPVHPFWRAL